MRAATETERLREEIAEVPHGCLSPRPSPGATQREMRAAPARAPLASPNNHHCSEPVPAARRAATAARGLRRIWHNRIAGLSAAERAAAGRLRAYCAPATPKTSPRHARPILCSSHFTLARRRLCPRRSKTTWARRACCGVLGAGPQAACAARCGPLESPFLSIPPSKTLSKQRASGAWVAQLRNYAIMLYNAGLRVHSLRR